MDIYMWWFIVGYVFSIPIMIMVEKKLRIGIVGFLMPVFFLYAVVEEIQDSKLWKSLNK